MLVRILLNIDASPLFSCRHYLVIPIEHIPTVKDLRRRAEDFSLGCLIYNWHFLFSHCATSGEFFISWGWILHLPLLQSVTCWLWVIAYCKEMHLMRRNIGMFFSEDQSWILSPLFRNISNDLVYLKVVPISCNNGFRIDLPYQDG